MGLVFATAASADDTGSDTTYAARARVSPSVNARPDDETASGTVIPVSDRSVALESVAEVVAEAPGARVRSAGGYGAYTTVGLRGAGAEHTTIVLGEVPLNSPDSGAFDLSLVPLSALSAVEVYRGGAPTWWSDGSIGGLVRLVPNNARTTSLGAHLGLGAFGRYEGGVQGSVARDGGTRPTLLSNVSYSHADNDYPYTYDGGTRLDGMGMSSTDDDVRAHQQNAQIDALDALLHTGVDVGGGRLELVALGHERIEGIPGPLAAPTTDTQRVLLRAFGALSWTREDFDGKGERRYRVQALGSGTYQNNQVSGPGEIGVTRPIAADDNWGRGYGRLAASVALAPFLEPTFVATIAHDAYDPHDPAAFTAPPRPSNRTTEALAAELRVHGRIGTVPWELRPSVRGQWSQTSIWADTGSGTRGEAQARDDVLATYRVGARIAPWSALAFTASAASGARLPSLLELFGDRALQEPNPALEPEHSRTLDASVLVRGRTGLLNASLELRGFGLVIDDMIAYRRTSQYTVKAENIDEGTVFGVEFGSRASVGRHFEFAGSVTAMQTENQFDKRLPLRPPLQVFARPEVLAFPSWADQASVFVEVDYTSFVYLDPANLTFIDGRAVVSLGGALSFVERRLRLAARIQNLLNVSAMDVLSRPLPGIGFLISLDVTEPLP